MKGWSVKGNLGCVVLLIFLWIIGAIFSQLQIIYNRVINNWFWPFVIIVLILVIATKIVISYYKNKTMQEKIAKLEISDDRNDYIISNFDYKRWNKKENSYRKLFKLPVLSVFDNECAKCRDSYNWVDIDHFVFSKNSWWCFIMIHRDWYLVNNAIPLCQSCNRSKWDRDYKEFFTKNELMNIYTKNQEMTELINEKKDFIDLWNN